MAAPSINSLSDEYYGVPLWGVFILIVLTWITVYRKRLSSNDEYRQKDKTGPKYELEILEFKQSAKILSKYNVMLQKMIFSPHKPEYRSSSTNSNCSLNKLSSELLVHLLSYLDTHEIVTISITSPRMRENFTSDIIWEQLWRVTYGRHWRHAIIRQLRESRDIYWDPADNFGPPQTGWYHFYLAFEVCWLDWLLAGYATEDKCLLAIDNAIYDVTDFMFDHPGSPETLSEGAGCDATELFYEISHTSFAASLKRRMCVWDMCAQYSVHPASTHLYTLDPNLFIPGSRVPNRSRLQRYLKQMQKSIAERAMESLLPNRSTKRAAAQAAQRMHLPMPTLSEPIVQFGPPRRPLKELKGYHVCPERDHAGQAKAYYDPLAGEWSVWWSCCGVTHTYLLGSD